MSSPSPTSRPSRAVRAALMAGLLAAGILGLECGRLSRQAPLTVYLTDGVSGAPLAGAAVTWCFTSQDPQTGSFRRFDEMRDTTGANGSCSFRKIAPERLGRRAMFLVDVSAPGFVHAVHIDSFAFDERRGLRLDLGILPEHGAARVEGAVREAATASPLAGVQMTITAARLAGSRADSAGDARFPPQTRYEGVTGEDGRFSAPVDYFALDRDSYHLAVVGVREGYAYARYDLGAFREMQDGHLAANYARVRCDLYLSDEARSVEVQGEVRDASGQPSTGREIVMAAVNYMGTCARGCCGGEPHSARIYLLTTNQAGSFSQKVEAPYLYGLRNGLRLSSGDEALYWRTPLGPGERQAENVLDFADGTRVMLTVTLAGSSP